MDAIVEKRTVEGAYGINSDQMIVDTDSGRLLICDDYGGDDINGYTHRWRHGVVVALLPGDTFETLAAPINDYGTTIFECATIGNDNSRPLQLWTGSAITNFVKKLLDEYAQRAYMYINKGGIQPN